MGKVGQNYDGLYNHVCMNSSNQFPIVFTASFLRESKMRLHVLLKKQEENQVCSLKEWVTREAANQDALQEAGTFRYKGKTSREVFVPFQ